MGVYFITTNTYNLHPYFGEEIFCDLFVEELEFCKKLKEFEIYGYKINPDHVHLMIQQGAKFNFSEVMHFLKRNFSQNANKIIGATQKGCLTSFQRRRCASSPLKEFDGIVKTHKDKFDSKYKGKHDLLPFKWQKSFHYHLIKDRRDFLNHLEYIHKQWQKHGLPENKYCYFVEVLPF
ncbi:MAG: transposase [Candidatus Margulisbacteria bacterium]|nr:transposase [Candidatus Margulisiibacteriota bacterium]